MCNIFVASFSFIFCSLNRTPTSSLRFLRNSAHPQESITSWHKYYYELVYLIWSNRSLDINDNLKIDHHKKKSWCLFQWAEMHWYFYHQHYNSVWPHIRQPTRLPPPWYSPGKNTGVGCHFILQCMKVKNETEIVQSCPTLSDPMDCSPPGSSIHGIF